MTRPVHTGDHVKTGQVLATLDRQPFVLAERSVKASIAQVDSRVSQLERDARRAATLLDQSAGSAESLEQIRSALKGARAQRSALRAQLAEVGRQRREATLRAPFDGVVTSALIDEGDVVSPGQAVLVLGGQQRTMEVELMVSEILIGVINVGDVVRVEAARVSSSVEATVKAVSSQARGASGLFPVRLELEPGVALRVGMTVEATVRVPSAPGWVVPVSAIVDPSGRAPYVLAVREGKATAVEVTLGAVRAEGALVQGALVRDDEVISVGHFAVQAGSVVEVKP